MISGDLYNVTKKTLDKCSFHRQFKILKINFLNKFTCERFLFSRYTTAHSSRAPSFPYVSYAISTTRCTTPRCSAAWPLSHLTSTSPCTRSAPIDINFSTIINAEPGESTLAFSTRNLDPRAFSKMEGGKRPWLLMYNP